MRNLIDSVDPVEIVVLLVVIIAAAAFVWRRRRTRAITPAPPPPDPAQLDADYLDSSHIINGPLTGKPGAQAPDSKPRS